MNISLTYKATKKQRMFHESDADEVLYGGAAGGGKSYAICWDALGRCLKWKGTHAYLFRRTFPELEDTLIKTTLSIVPPSIGRYVKNDHNMYLANGSVMHFCYCDNEGDNLTRYHGAEMHWLYFDELTHFTKLMYDYLRTRLRAPVELGITPCVRSASNPGGPGHSWVKQRFVDATDIGTHICELEIKSDMLGETSVKRIQYIPATVMDNPHISKTYVYELEQKPKNLRDALLNGKWDAFEGQAFPEFTNDPEHYTDRLWTHVIEPFEIPLHWTRYVSFDHGYTRPFSLGVWAVDPDGRAYRYKELYGCVPGEANTGIKISPGEIAQRLADLVEPERREGIHIIGIADPAIWDRSRGLSVEEQMRSACSVVVFQKGDNTRLPGKMQVHERMKFDEYGRPMFYVFNTCADFIRTIPSLSYDAKKVEDIDTAGEDHIYDETRYFFMSRPIAPRPDIKKPATKRFDPLS